MDECSVEGCVGKPTARGWCGKHYARWRIHGDPLVRLVPTRDMTPEERLRFYGWTVTESGCWEFSGSRGRHGYGQLRIDGHKVGAHRVAYEAWVEPVPEGLHVLHSCNNRACINPAHLRVGNHVENMADLAASGRSRNQWTKEV